MPTTCPRCGTSSSATSESCGICGHDLYRLAYPASSATLRLTFRQRVPARLMVSAVLLLAGAGVTTALLLTGGDEDQEPISKNRAPASSVPREPTPSAPPVSAEPLKTKAPPKPAPSTTQPVGTPSAEASPKRDRRPPFAGIREAEKAWKFADEVREWADERHGRWDRP